VIVLGFDTATAATAVGLRLPGGEVLQERDDPAPGQRAAHAVRLLPLAHALLSRAELPWEAIDRIAVGTGPGTFTGLRIGVATARALSQSLDVPVVAVSSLRALAEHAQPEAGERRVLAAIDARRGEVFAAAWAGDRELVGPRAIAPEALAGWVQELGPVSGGAPWLGVGDGAVRFRSHLQAAGIEVPADGADLHRVSAAAICRLGVNGPPLAPEAVLPDYRRRPDAEMTASSPETSRQK
jgi:tRNA threonylcarbamoyladenosine biosynthesis protein TsaB